ncbi:hypothetical protein B4088_0933 [Bacillus cereus]|uniref:Uncharacterized protein n=1 Tax=Bacillus cereus TaxID=1396 RepID=A0A164QEI3_BACCE|nr:hypothetical protein B4088_0933 [Bacillus cereus]
MSIPTIIKSVIKCSIEIPHFLSDVLCIVKRNNNSLFELFILSPC